MRLMHLGWFERRVRRHPAILSLWCVVAAFGTYACMYGFRKPFTAGVYDHDPFEPGFKSLLVLSQVLGYTLSKWFGIGIVAAMPPARRAPLFFQLVLGAEIAWVLFGLVPPSLGLIFLFLNGLLLGLGFGLVLGFLEGRRLTEAFVAGLCASFILADGVTKSVGASLLTAGVPERWMPAVSGLVFLGPIAGFLWMLRQIPGPTSGDVAERAERLPLDRPGRRAFVSHHLPALVLIVAAYLLVTVLRSVRADFAPELWAELGVRPQASLFARSEVWVALGVLTINGLACTIRDNRRALAWAFGISLLGLVIVAAAFGMQRSGQIGAFSFMVCLGLGLYLPYVAVHTTLFERMVALSPRPGNVGHLMYLADTAGYLGYLAVMIGSWIEPSPADLLARVRPLGLFSAGAGFLCLLAAALWLFSHATARQKVAGSPDLGLRV
ncbi:MAG: hypothetical protein KIT22_03220 [Verrucomicrobiae bacterium]|nr:hypothetical protein [Verrucomicrobiae bacterium]